jgi:hypothetical protein
VSAARYFGTAGLLVANSRPALRFSSHLWSGGVRGKEVATVSRIGCCVAAGWLRATAVCRDRAAGLDSRAGVGELARIARIGESA